MNATPTLGAPDSVPPLPYDYTALPVAQLESLRSKINQMIDSIQTLQRTVEAGGQNAMPAWPDILSKYTMLLSQSHNLSMSLVGTFGAISASGSKPSMNGLSGHGSVQAGTNPYERLALHPSVSMTDAQLDNDIIPLLRNQQTTDVLKYENETVRHLAEHMATRGSLGVLSLPSSQPSANIAPDGIRRPGIDASKKVDYADVLKECEQIRLEHDERVDRAVRAVALLREKYDWKARVEVDQEEPEELEWDPRFAGGSGQGAMNADAESAGGHGDQANGDESNTSEEEEELEEVLGNGADQSPEGTPQPPSPMAES